MKNPALSGYQILRDPMPIPQNIDMVKSGTGYNIHIQAHDLKAVGLGDLSINYLKAIQRTGHRDLRVNLTLCTNLRLEGLYSLKVFLITGRLVIDVLVTLIHS